MRSPGCTVCAARPRFQRLTRCDAGQAAVEFALALPVLLLLLFGVIECGRLFYTRLTARNITLEATRFAVTGQPGSEATRAESVRQLVYQKAASLKIPAGGSGPDRRGFRL